MEVVDVTEPTHELVVTAQGADGTLALTIAVHEEPETRFTGYIQRKARDLYADAFSSDWQPTVSVDFRPLATTAIVAGPQGHWYTIFRDELIAFPMDSDPHAPPPKHPSEQDDGWYTPDDLSGEDRVAVVARIRGDAEPSIPA
jgi:hypothetical protein